MYFIGIDLGTSSLKLLLVDRQGTVLRTVTKEYPLLFPQPGWSEQEPSHWWQAVLEGVAFAIRDSFAVARSLGIAIPRAPGQGSVSDRLQQVAASPSPCRSAAVPRSPGAYGGELYECPVTVESEKDMQKAAADVKAAGCNAPIKGLYELGVEIEENSELDLLAAYKTHAGDPRIDGVCRDMATEMGEGRYYSELPPRMAQFELTLLDWAEAHKGSRKYVAFADKCWPAFPRTRLRCWTSTTLYPPNCGRTGSGVAATTS